MFCTQAAYECRRDSAARGTCLSGPLIAAGCGLVLTAVPVPVAVVAGDRRLIVAAAIVYVAWALLLIAAVAG